MKERDRKIAEELKRRLSEVVRIVNFRVFGSRARGTADEYSDMDVFLEVESLDAGTGARISDIVWEVGYENLLVITPLIVTRDEIENTALRSAPIMQTIEEEGVPV